jgi:AcrR family transcriptional regulator
MVSKKKTAHIQQSPKLPAEVRRRQLLGVAERLFLKKGYRATTVDEIARGARLTKGAFYHHFKNKEDILCAIVEHTAEQFIEGLSELPKGTVTPVDLFKALQRISEKEDTPKIRNDVEFRLQALKIARVRALVERMLKRGVTIFSERIDPRYARTAEDRRQLAIFTFCLWDGLSLRMLADPSFVNLKRQTKLLESLFAEGKSAGKRN